MTTTAPAAAGETADLLYGVKAIGEFLQLPRRATQHRIDQGVVPTFRMGGSICARRSTLNAWLAECEREAMEVRASARRAAAAVASSPTATADALAAMEARRGRHL